MPAPPKTIGAGGIMCSSLSVREWVCASRKQHCEHLISKTNEGNFAQFWSQMYLGSYADLCLVAAVGA